MDDKEKYGAEIPDGTGYDNWTWQQCMAAVCGAANGAPGGSEVSDESTMFSTANALMNFQTKLGWVVDGINAEIKAVAGANGALKGPAADALHDGVKRVNSVVEAQFNHLSRPGNRKKFLASEINGSGNRLSKAKEEMYSIAEWYGDQWIMAGGELRANSASTADITKAGEKFTQMLNSDMRRVLVDLAGNYTITTSSAIPPPRPPDDLRTTSPTTGDEKEVDTGIDIDGDGKSDSLADLREAIESGELGGMPDGVQTDAQGNPVDAEGNPVDAQGNPIPFPGSTGGGPDAPLAPGSPSDIGLPEVDPFDPSTSTEGTGAGTLTPPGTGVNPTPWPGGGGLPGGGNAIGTPGQGGGMPNPVPFPGTGGIGGGAGRLGGGKNPSKLPNPVPFPGTGGGAGGLGAGVGGGKNPPKVPNPIPFPGLGGNAQRPVGGGTLPNLKDFKPTQWPGLGGAGGGSGTKLFSGAGGGGGGLGGLSGFGGAKGGSGIGQFGEAITGRGPGGGGGGFGGTGALGGAAGGGRGGGFAGAGGPGQQNMPPYMPPMSPQQNQNNQERERNVHLVEDDIWGADPTVTPAVIGRVDNNV